MVTQAADHAQHFLVRNVSTAVFQLVAIDRFRKFPCVWREILIRVPKLPAFDSVASRVRGTTSIDKRRNRMDGIGICVVQLRHVTIRCVLETVATIWPRPNQHTRCTREGSAVTLAHSTPWCVETRGENSQTRLAHFGSTAPSFDTFATTGPIEGEFLRVP